MGVKNFTARQDMDSEPHGRIQFYQRGNGNIRVVMDFPDKPALSCDLTVAQLRIAMAGGEVYPEFGLRHYAFDIDYDPEYGDLYPEDCAWLGFGLTDHNIHLRGWVLEYEECWKYLRELVSCTSST